jgi:gamma-glutamylcyclotransferase (GGCT)/AIG2-like uncharacterized protein YtfP
MMHISSNKLYLPFLSKALDYCAGPLAQCIVCADENNYPVAGVIYDGYNGAIIHAHIWIDAERKPMKEWYSCIFDYPFNRLGVNKVVGQVNSNNTEAIKLDEHFGFELEATVKHYYDDGASLLVYTMSRGQCRILNSPAWQKLNEKIAGLV